MSSNLDCCQKLCVTLNIQGQRAKTDGPERSNQSPGSLRNPVCLQLTKAENVPNLGAIWELIQETENWTFYPIIIMPL